MPKYPKIDAFKNDGKLRMIYLHGGIVQAHNGNVLAEVFCKCIENNRLSDKIYLYRIPATDVDFLKIGRVWKGYAFEKDNFLKLQKQEFKFNFNIYTPETILYKHIPWSDESGMKKIFSQYAENMENSRFTMLTSDSGMIVVIPSLEFLSNAVIPEDTNIRRELLKQSLDDILEKYVTHAEEVDGKYKIRLKAKHFKKNITFLAYLKLNEITRKRLSQIRSSIEKKEIMPSGNDNPCKHPIILPCHPNNMRISGEGMMVSNNIFLMLRIEKVSDMTDHIIVKLEKKNNTTRAKKQKSNAVVFKSKEYELDDEHVLVGDSNPHIKNGHVKIDSEISRIGKATVIETEWCDFESNSDEVTIINQDKKAGQLSSEATRGNQEFENTMSLKQGKNKQNGSFTDEDECFDKTIENAIKNLKDLLKRKKIKRYMFVDNTAHESDECVYCSTDMGQSLNISNDYFERWHIKKTITKEPGAIKEHLLRRYLLVNIELNDDKNIYYLEIERKFKSESLSGLLFCMENKISDHVLKDLLKTIVLNNGSYKRQVNKQYKKSNSKQSHVPIRYRDVKLPVDCHISFRHRNLKEANLLGIEIEKVKSKCLSCMER